MENSFHMVYNVLTLPTSLPLQTHNLGPPIRAFHPLILWDWFWKGKRTNPEPYLELSLGGARKRYTGTFWKFTLCHLAFMKGLHQYLFLLTKRNPERIFASMKKKQKVKIAFRVCLAASCYKGSEHPGQWEGPCRTPSLGTTSSCSALSLQRFELCHWAAVPYLNLFSASISKIYPKIIASPLYTISCRERFLRKALLSDSKGNLYSFSLRL